MIRWRLWKFLQRKIRGNPEAVDNCLSTEHTRLCRTWRGNGQILRFHWISFETSRCSTTQYTHRLKSAWKAQINLHCRLLMLKNETQYVLFANQSVWFLAPALLPTHVSLRTSASSSTKMVCVAVRYRVPTLLLLGDTRSSSLTFSTWRRKRKTNMKLPSLHCSSDHRCAHVISALINTPCSRTRLLTKKKKKKKNAAPKTLADYVADAIQAP